LNVVIVTQQYVLLWYKI